MTPETIISKRIIRDHMLSNNVLPHTIEITQPMIKEFRSARQRYATHLEDENEKREKSDNERKSRLILDDIEKLKSRQVSLNKSIALLESESTDCMDKGEEKMDITLFVKANTLKRKTRELKEQLESLDSE